MTTPKLTPGTAIRVKWDDAGCPESQHWLNPNEIKDMHHITSLGYFMKQTKCYFTIAQTMSISTTGQPEYGNAFCIPAGCIRKITRI